MVEYILGVVPFSNRLSFLRARQGPRGRHSVKHLSQGICTGFDTDRFPETEEWARVVHPQQIRMANDV